jgi:hypothetical protein
LSFNNKFYEPENPDYHKRQPSILQAPTPFPFSTAKGPTTKKVVHESKTMEAMRDPVITADGQTYERGGIQSLFAVGKRTSPLTGAELPSTHVTPNIALHNVIQESDLLN